MTFSIAARSADGESWGVAVASKFLGVGAAVPAARAGLGAIATQSFANVAYKRAGLALLADGRSAQETLDSLLAGDPGRAKRQAGVVDAQGGAATFTGDECYAWAGGITGPGVAIQGNILTGPEVVQAMYDGWVDSAAGLHLSDRLLRALIAGDGAGGDSRGRQSAALLVVREAGGYGHFDDVEVDLRVDDHAAPCAELARMLKLHHLLFLEPEDDDLVPIEGDVADEIERHLRTLGFADLDAWLGAENLEMRVRDRSIDRRVLDRLREQASGD